jgi:hypothetical protein
MRTCHGKHRKCIQIMMTDKVKCQNLEFDFVPQRKISGIVLTFPRLVLQLRAPFLEPEARKVKYTHKNNRRRK